MKITFEVENLSTFISAYNNAYLAYHDFVCGATLGLTDHVPSSLRPVLELPEEELLKRQKILYDIYPQLLEIEDRVCKNSKNNI